MFNEEQFVSDLQLLEMLENSNVRLFEPRLIEFGFNCKSKELAGDLANELSNLGIQVELSVNSVAESEYLYDLSCAENIRPIDMIYRSSYFANIATQFESEFYGWGTSHE